MCIKRDRNKNYGRMRSQILKGQLLLEEPDGMLLCHARMETWDDESQAVAAEIIHRWNVYPKLLQALRDIDALQNDPGIATVIKGILHETNQSIM